MPACRDVRELTVLCALSQNEMKDLPATLLEPKSTRIDLQSVYATNFIYVMVHGSLVEIIPDANFLVKSNE